MVHAAARSLTLIALAIALPAVMLGGAGPAGAASAPRADTGPAQLTAQKTLRDRVVELTIATPAFAEPTKVQVTLPVGYDADPSRRWPVTYFMAGTQNSERSFNDFLNGPKLTERYPSIVVSPDSNSGYWSDWYNDGKGGAPMYETFVVDQLLPLIDRTFRTQPDRGHRAIFGISMGGYGALMLAARHPDRFVAAASLSGTVDTNLALNAAVLSLSSTFDQGAPDAIYGPRATQEVRWRGHNPADLGDNLRTMDVQVRSANGILDPGIGEGADPKDSLSCVVEGGVYGASVSLHQQLAATGVPHLWKDYGPGCHTVPNFTREVNDTLAAFAPILAAAPAAPKRFSYRSIEPHFGVFGWTVDADRARPLEFLALKDAGATGATFTGTGSTAVTTPPLFAGLRAVDVVTAGAKRTLAPDRGGRLRFTVDLGPVHADQQFTVASRAAGDGNKGYFTSRAVTFRPHSRLVVSTARRTRTGARVCLRVVGPPLAGATRLSLLDARGHRVAPVRSMAARGTDRCVLLTGPDRLAAGRHTVRATGQDRFGHRVVATARAR